MRFPIPVSVLTLSLLAAACGAADSAPSSAPEFGAAGPPKPEGRRERIYSKEDRERALAKTRESTPRWEGPSPVRFVEQLAARGIDFEQFNGRSDQRYYVEIVGSGAIFFDAEGDGDPDLYLLNQTNVDGPPPSPRAQSAFFVNDGSGHFSVAPDDSGLVDRRYSIGVCGGDVDNDGDTDLYVTRFGAPHSLYRNDGNLRFTDIAATAGVEGDKFTHSSCAFGDVDNDGWLDLYYGVYVEANREINPPCWKKLKGSKERVREYCGPGKYSMGTGHLYRNRKDGTFEDISESSGTAASKGNSLGLGFADWDRDGDQDLYVACDRTQSLLFENDGTGKFTESAMKYAIGLSEDGTPEAGMGTAWGDYDNDGWLDLVKTNYEYENNNLFRNLEGKGFVDMAGPSGAGAPSFSYLGWGIDFLDADNDGDLDFYVANGHLRDDIDKYETQSGGVLEGYEQLNLFFLQTDPGRFISMAAAAGPGLEVRKVSRGLTSADIDLDGDVDLLVMNQHERPDLLVNESPSPGHWLSVDCRGTKSNRSGIGARVEIVAGDSKQLRQVRSGQAYLGQAEFPVHFGLGTARRVDTVTVRWPSGIVDTIRDVDADGRIVVVEGSGRAGR